jgi:uncharacterized YigZ family protein
MKRYPVPAEETRSELRVVNSRFIATIAPASSAEEAREFIARINNEFDDASHNVPAFVIGYGPSVTAHCNDDGEPSGTAGRPALAVLQGSGLGDGVVVVTRYFGGTKLGRGGLVRAYGDAVRQVLKVVPIAEKVPTHLVMLVVPYSHLERVRLLVADQHGRIIEEDFATDITITCQFTTDRFSPFQLALTEMSHGTLQAEIIETNEATIMPLDAFPLEFESEK